MIIPVLLSNGLGVIFLIKQTEDTPMVFENRQWAFKWVMPVGGPLVTPSHPGRAESVLSPWPRVQSSQPKPVEVSRDRTRLGLIPRIPPKGIEGTVRVAVEVRIIGVGPRANVPVLWPHLQRADLHRRLGVLDFVEGESPGSGDL